VSQMGLRPATPGSSRCVSRKTEVLIVARNVADPTRSSLEAHVESHTCIHASMIRRGKCRPRHFEEVVKAHSRWPWSSEALIRAPRFPNSHSSIVGFAVGDETEVARRCSIPGNGTKGVWFPVALRASVSETSNHYTRPNRTTQYSSIARIGTDKFYGVRHLKARTLTGSRTSGVK